MTAALLPALLPALLCGASTAVLVSRPHPASRLRALAPAGAPSRRPDATSPVVLKGLGALLGVALWWVVGGVTGAALGVLAAWLTPSLVGRLDDTEDEAAALARQLPLALDLLGACLAGGSGLPEAVTAVGAALGGPCGHRLDRVAAALAVGLPPGEAFRALGDDRGPAGTAARALARAADGGAPVASAVRSVAADARRETAAAATQRARRSGVKMAGPLGACFLPAFVTLSVVPTVAGLAGPMLRTL
jgi:pilus assembly protein TadC